MDAIEMLRYELAYIKAELERILRGYEVIPGPNETMTKALCTAKGRFEKGHTRIVEDAKMLERIGKVTDYLYNHLIRLERYLIPKLDELGLSTEEVRSLAKQHEEIVALSENLPFIHIDEPEMFLKIERLYELVLALESTENQDLFKKACESLSEPELDQLGKELLEDDIRQIEYTNPVY